MPIADQVDPLITTHEPMGCHLQAIKSVAGCFAFASGAKKFDALLQQNHGQGGGYKGQYFTGTIVSLSDIDGVGFKRDVKELEKRGFKLLGIQDGAHGRYKMHLYGMGFTLPKQKRTWRAK